MFYKSKKKQINDVLKGNKLKVDMSACINVGRSESVLQSHLPFFKFPTPVKNMKLDKFQGVLRYRENSDIVKGISNTKKSLKDELGI